MLISDPPGDWEYVRNLERASQAAQAAQAAHSLVEAAHKAAEAVQANADRLRVTPSV